MKNPTKLKRYQKKLYNALGKAYGEEILDRNWLSSLYGFEWDNLYERGLVENNFCGLCGNDKLTSDYCRIPAFSKHKVQIPICDDCWNERGYEEIIELRSNFKRKFRMGCIGILILLIILSYLLFF